MERQRGQLIGPLVSLILGALSVAPLLGIVAGLPAIVVGFLCLRALNASDDESPPARAGRRLAIGGMVFGALGCLIGIVGLVSMLAMQANEANRRATCTNNLRQLGLAVNLYRDVMSNVYPSATVDGPWGLAGFAPWMSEPYKDRLGWMVNVLPFLDKPQRGPKRPGPYIDLRGTFQAHQGWRGPGNEEGANTTIRGYLCPSHPHHDTSHKPAASHYVGLTGVGSQAVELSSDDPNAGFFGYERLLRVGNNLPNPMPKGQSYTLLAAETMMDNGPWVAGDYSTLRGIVTSNQPYVGYERPFGGMHPGGVNLLMADAGVEFFKQTGQPKVFEQMARLTLGKDVMEE